MYTATKYTVTSAFRHLLGVAALLLISFTARGQETSRNNYTGLWTTNGSWSDNSAPAATSISQNITINGYITYTGNIDFDGAGGDLIVNDTLYINGSLTLGNNNNITVNDNGVLIITGNLTLDNNVDIAANAYIVVLGNLTKSGAANQGTFTTNDSPSNVFIGGTVDVPGTWGQGANGVLDCNRPLEHASSTCNYGNYTDLSNNPIFPFVSTGGFNITPTGAATICPGTGSVALALSPTGGTSAYQWYRNGVAIAGATAVSYTATQEGSYEIRFTYNSTNYAVSKTVSYTNEIPVITGNTQVYENHTQVYTTTSGMSGYTWTVTGGTIQSGQGTKSVQVLWGTVGGGTIQVQTTFGGCTVTSANVAITKNVFPSTCFEYRSPLTISNTMVNGGANLTNFPVLISVTNNALRHSSYGGNIAHFNGYDITFATNADGSGRLNYQLEYYNPSTGNIIAWVNLPTLYSAANTNLYLFFSNPSITIDASTDAVFGTDYVGVYHLGSAIPDNGPRANDGTNVGSEIVAGKIGQARHFTRAEKDYVQLANQSDFNFTSNMTVSFWVNVESFSTAAWGDYIIKGDNANWRFVGPAGTRQMYFSFGTGGTDGGFTCDLASGNNALTAGRWIFVAGTFDGASATRRKRLYVYDGATLGFWEQTTGLPASLQSYTVNTEPVLFGINSQADDSRAFNGMFDEVRISNITKTTEWLRTEYNNQNNPSTYITMGAPVQIYTPSATGGSVNAIATTLFANEWTTVTLTGHTGTIQWQSSTDNITFTNLAGETSATLYTDPLVATTYFRAMVTNGGCPTLSTVDSVIVNPAFLSCSSGLRKKITVPAANVYGTDDLTSFPLLVKINSDNDLRTAANGGDVQNANGYDIRFTAADGTTLLAHQVESYNATTGAYTAWVKVPVLSTNEDTYIYLNYGDVSATNDPSTSAVWTNGYTGVWHMGSSLTDATGNGNTGTNSGTSTQSGANAFIHEANGFNGTSNYITIANESNFDLNTGEKITLSAWVYVNNYGGAQYRYIDKGPNAWRFQRSATTGTNLQMYHEYSGADYIQATNTSGLTTGGWRYITATFDHSVNSMVVYINGSPANSTKNDPATSTLTNNDFQVRLGAAAGTVGDYFNGRMDEVRISNVLRTADWIRTEYNNQLNPAAFYTLGTEESCISTPVGGTVTANNDTLCTGQSVTLTVTGHTGSIYWQTSTDNTNWSYVGGENSTSMTYGPITQTRWFRASVSLCCEVYSNSVRVVYSSVTPPSLSYTITDIVCNGDNNGVIDLAVANGTSPFRYNWSNGLTTQDISGLAPGSYNITVNDATGCYVTGSATVAEPTLLTVTVSTINENCQGDSTGQATATPSGGTSPYTYLWNTGETLNNATGLTTGNYQVTVTDDNGCTTENNSISISYDFANPIITLSSDDLDNIFCSSTNITFTASAGMDNYDFYLNNTLEQSGVINTFSTSAIADGETVFVIASLSGCSASSDTIVNTVNPLNTVGVASSTPTLCPYTLMTDITHTTTNATGIGTPSGLPAGVGAVWAANLITISGTPTESGVFNYTIPLTGGCGSVEATGTITVPADNTAPTISCPANVYVNAAAGTCSAIVNGLALLSYSDDCTSAANLVRTYTLTGSTTGSGSNDASSGTFNTGVSQITYMVIDQSANASTCSFMVIVRDVDPPVISCPADISQNTTEGSCNATINYVVSATDNCAGSITQFQDFQSGDRNAEIAKGWAFSGSVLTNVLGSWRGDMRNFIIGSRSIATPFYSFNGNTTIRFNHYTSGINNGGRTHNFRIYLVDGTGTTTTVFDSSIAASYGLTNQQITFNATGLYRIRFSMDVTGSGYSGGHLYIDDIIVPAAFASTLSATGVATPLATLTPIQTDVSGLTSGSNFPVGTTTQSYKVYDASGNVANCSFNITLANPVSITTQPANITGCSGDNVSVSVVAAGNNLTYQWRDAGTNIAGETNASLVFNPATTTDSGTYDVVVSGCGTSVTSNPAIITINYTPVSGNLYREPNR